MLVCRLSLLSIAVGLLIAARLEAAWLPNGFPTH
jgi:hypothetical protein